MNNPMYFEIQAADPSKLVTFYSTVFGWECTKDESIPVEYWRIRTEGINGGILKEPAQKANPSSGTNAFTCSMENRRF
jgi:predicted enzyme related to lactoylglutathione lyase